MQTVFGDGREGRPAGNCHAACIASILELPIENVPNFAALSDEEFEPRRAKWLREQGFAVLSLSTEGGTEETVEAVRTAVSQLGYHIKSGMGPRGVRHSVVGYGDQIVHDPFPGGGGVEADWFTILIPLEPHR